MPVNGKMINLKIGRGYFVEEGKAGVLILHALWGLNDFFKGFSNNLSKEGFSVLALDLYHGQIAADIESAKRLRGYLDRQAAHEEIKSAVAYLREATGNQIGIIGFSMGANLALWTIVIKILVRQCYITAQAAADSVKESRQCWGILLKMIHMQGQSKSVLCKIICRQRISQQIFISIQAQNTGLLKTIVQNMIPNPHKWHGVEQLSSYIYHCDSFTLNE